MDNNMKHRSGYVSFGEHSASNRSLFYALGYTEEDISKPLIGVCSAYSEIVPGHAHLDKVAEAVKAGVQSAGGTPIMFPSIGVCDGIAMGHEGMKYSLASRELIADSVESMAIAHCFDALADPKLRQDRTHVDGRGKAEHPFDRCKRRAHACGQDRRKKLQACRRFGGRRRL